LPFLHSLSFLHPQVTLLDPSVTSQLPADTLRCYDSWYAPGPPNATVGTLTTIDGSPFVVDSDIPLCGNFIVPAGVPMVVGIDAVVTIAGNLLIAKNGNLTFIGKDPATHGVINFGDGCGLPGVSTAPGAFQFATQDNTTLNIHGFAWPDKAKTTYNVFVSATQCVNVSSSDLYMNWVTEIPQGSAPFPFIHTGCKFADVARNNDTGFQIFHDLFPVNLPDRCSNIQAFPLTDVTTDIYVEINKKDLCFNQIVTMGVFIPAGILAAVGAGAWYSASSSSVQTIDYMTL